MAATAFAAPLRRLRPTFSAVSRAIRRVLGPVRRVRADRVVPPAALVAAVALVLVETPLAVTRYGILVPVAFALAVLHAGALAAALRRPNLAAAVSLAAALALHALSARTAMVWPWWPVLIVTQSLVLAVVAGRAGLWPALLHWVLAIGLSASLAALLRPEGGVEASTDLVVFGGVSVAAIVAALLAAQWRRISSELVHERRVAVEEAERRVLIEERTRIARELHDVVAHSLSIITVQSSTARFRHREFSAEAADEFDRIGAQSRRALEEMRGLLRVLRGSDDDADRRPQPGLTDLPDLVERARAAGTRITLRQPDGAWAADVGALTGLTAYRIVQEATSNAIRHAPGAAVEVALSRTAEGVDVRVTNSTPSGPPAPSSAQPGHGLVGMAERAASAEGTLAFGRTDEGGFSVRASLPDRRTA